MSGRPIDVRHAQRVHFKAPLAKQAGTGFWNAMLYLV